MSKDIALLNRNPKNGRFGLARDPVTKDVIGDDSQEHAVMSQLVEFRKKWWADEDGTHGSDLNQIKNFNKSTSSDAEAAARQALALLESKGLIAVQSVAAAVPPPGSLGRFTVTVAWSKRGSNQIQTTKMVV